MSVTIWFEPHSTSLDNEAGLASGWNDVDLSEQGAKQSQELAARCRSRGIDAIFVSDLQRSYKTAVPLAKELKVPIYVDSRLRECDYGEYTQKPKKELDSIKIMHMSESFPNGESYNDCMLRVHDFLVELKKNFNGKTILIIGHRATQYGIENMVLHKPLDQSLTEAWQWQPGWKYECA